MAAAESNLPGVTWDADREADRAELESALGGGVVANAEEMIRFHKSLFPADLRKAQMKGENEPLTEIVNDEDADNLDKLADAVDVEEIATATVRGRDAEAVIVYAYLDERGVAQKGVIPYKEVLGSPAKRTRRASSAPTDADRKKALAEAAKEREKIITDAKKEAEALLDEARDDAAKLVAEAETQAAAASSAASTETKPADEAEAKARAAKAK